MAGQPPETVSPPSGTGDAGPADHADVAADPRRWTSHRALLVVTAVLALAFLVTLALALLSWHTPALSPIDVPTAPSA